MSIDIPIDLQPAIEAAATRGGYASEQDLVSDILRAALPVLADYQKLRSDVQASLTDLEQGNLREADFSAVREQLCREYDENGNRK